MSKWIDWEGGECPVPQDTLINVRLRNGTTHFNQPALRDSLILFVDHRFWDNNNHPSDIVAYQLVASEEKPSEKNSEGWIEWESGDCPVPSGTLIDVKYRCGDTKESAQALIEEGVLSFYWRRDDRPYDIVAYRVVGGEKPKQEPKSAKKMLKVLTEEGLELQDEFESKYGVKGNCSCHTGNPPCSSCTHPGHPIALEESEEYWRMVEVESTPSSPLDLIWGSW